MGIGLAWGHRAATNLRHRELLHVVRHARLLAERQLQWRRRPELGARCSSLALLAERRWRCGGLGASGVVQPERHRVISSEARLHPFPTLAGGTEGDPPISPTMSSKKVLAVRLQEHLQLARVLAHARGVDVALRPAHVSAVVRWALAARA